MMARSKSEESTPRMMEISSELWVIMRMLMPALPRAPKILPEVPERLDMLRPTTEMRARLSTMVMSSGLSSRRMSATME